MLEFYYEFLDRYVNQCDFELIQMDIDSNYVAISGETVEDVIKPELRAEFTQIRREANTKQVAPV